MWRQPNNFGRKSEATGNLKTGRFDNADSAVIISSVCKVAKNRSLQFCTALHTLLMMTAESMLSKRPVLRFTVALLFLFTLFSSHCVPNNFDLTNRRVSLGSTTIRYTNPMHFVPNFACFLAINIKTNVKKNNRHQHYNSVSNVLVAHRNAYYLRAINA